jgi:hypothetical protein
MFKNAPYKLINLILPLTLFPIPEYKSKQSAQVLAGAHYKVLELR